MCKIREYEVQDVEEIISLGRLMHEEGAYSFLPYEPNKLKLLLYQFKVTGNGNVWIGFENDIIVGMISVFITEYFFCYEKIVQDLVLYVHPDFRNKNSTLAIKLIKSAEQWAKFNGAKEFCPASSISISSDKVAKLYTFLKYETVGHLFKKRLQ